MSKIVKIVLVVISVPIVLIIGLFTLGYVLEERIVAMSLQYLNSQVSVSIKADDIKVSMIKGFPRVSIILKRVSIAQGSLNWPQEFDPGLLSMEEITLRINLRDILKNEFNVDDVILRNGRLNLYFDNRGNSNFNIFTADKASSGQWLLNLNRLVLDNVHLNYTDLSTGWIFKGLVESASIRGNFSKQSQSLALRSSLKVSSLRQGHLYFIRNTSISLSAVINVTSTEVQFNNVEVQMGSTRLGAMGSIGRQKGDTIAFDMYGANFDVEQLVNFLTQYQLSLPAGTKTKGSVGFELSLTGKSRSTEPFAINLLFASNKFSLSLPNKPVIEFSALNGKFSNGSKGNLETSEILIDRFQLKSLSSTVGGSFRIRNINTPIVHFNLNPMVEFADLKAWRIIHNDISGTISGNTEALVHLSALDTIHTESINIINAYSELNFSNIHYAYSNDIRISGTSGTLVLDNRDIDDLRVSGYFNDSQFSALANIQNALGYFLNEGRASANASIAIDSLNTKWFAFSQVSDTTANDDSGFKLWDALSYISGKVNVESFIHNNFYANAIGLDIFISEERISSREFKGNTCEGKFEGAFIAVKQPQGVRSYSSNINLQGINISKLFLSFNSFNQQALTNSNIGGTLSSQASMSINSTNSVFNTKSLDLVAKIEVTEGSLNSVSQLEQLARFIALEELQNIRFKTLTNTIRIHNQQITIPRMEIQSSALNIFASGNHNFNGSYEYLFDLQLSDILFRKATRNKQANADFGEEEDDGTSRTRLHLKLVSDGETSGVSYDRSSARQSRRDALREERVSINQIFRNEFRGRVSEPRTNDASTVKGKAFGLEWDEDVKVLDDTPPASDKLEIKTEAKENQKPAFSIEWDDE
jgi:dimeric dUTPase (all-alpha-NTP-PPase superfamily)